MTIKETEAIPEKEKNNDCDTFEELWEYVITFNPNPSACMLAVKAAIKRLLSRQVKDPLELTDRIGKHIKFVLYGTKMLSKTEGEWHITNEDLKFWEAISFFGNRDYFPGRWRNISNSISSALHDKRCWQTFERYKHNGGLKAPHRTLLRHLIWDMDVSRRDMVSLYVDGKSPFGNSYIEMDIIRILDWEVNPNEDISDEDISDETQERCWEIFDELQFAIIDVLGDNLRRVEIGVEEEEEEEMENSEVY
jgi:hypothetical protein